MNWVQKQEGKWQQKSEMTIMYTSKECILDTNPSLTNNVRNTSGPSPNEESIQQGLFSIIRSQDKRNVSVKRLVDKNLWLFVFETICRTKIHQTTLFPLWIVQLTWGEIITSKEAPTLGIELSTILQSICLVISTTSQLRQFQIHPSSSILYPFHIFLLIKTTTKNQLGTE